MSRSVLKARLHRVQPLVEQGRQCAEDDLKANGRDRGGIGSRRGGRHGGQRLQVGAESHVRPDNRPGRRSDNDICRRQIHPRTPQADDDSSFPGDTRDAAAAKHHTSPHTPSLMRRTLRERSDS
jgi:hypothetical protein